MKKLLMLTLIMVSVIFAAETITIKEWANVRKNHSAKSEIIDSAKPGTELEVLEAWADYIYIEVIKGKDKKSTSTRVGDKGWMYSKYVGDGVVLHQGAALRTEPRKAEDTLDGTVKGGAAIKIIDKNIVWYKTKLGWISKVCVE